MLFWLHPSHASVDMYSLSRSVLLPFVALLGALTLTSCDVFFGDDKPASVFEEAEANRGQWTWIGVEGAQCRDGSPTGLGVRLQEGADDLVIFMEGGGACFNDPTCSQNRARFGEADFTEGVAEGVGDQGLFNTQRAENPVGNWNYVYVPYCTGDVHSGSAEDVQVPGVAGAQQFVGYDNFTRYADLLKGYFGDDLGQILVTGSSAGGFGTLANYEQVAQRFPAASVTLLDDAGPLVPSDSVLTPGLQQLWISLWNLDETYPGPGLEAPSDLETVYQYYADTYDANFGLASYEEDETIRFFYSFGLAAQDPECAVSLSREEPCISGAAYERALYDLRDQLPEEWKTFYPDGETHTFLREEDRYFEPTAGDRALSQWLGDLLNGQATDEGTPEGAAPTAP